MHVLECPGWSDSWHTRGTADSILKVAHITRTRHAHSVIVAALAVLQKASFDAAKSASEAGERDAWRARMTQKFTTFAFYDFILRMEKLILIFVRAHREINFALYVVCMEAPVFMFFSLNHLNYSRWVSVHLENMKTLLRAAWTMFIECDWYSAKTIRQFSTMPVDQAHEQANESVNGKGGIIRLTDNAAALQRWLLAGQELTRLLRDFKISPAVQAATSEMHRDETLATKVPFRCVWTRRCHSPIWKSLRA